MKRMLLVIAMLLAFALIAACRTEEPGPTPDDAPEVQATPTPAPADPTPPPEELAVVMEEEGAVRIHPGLLAAMERFPA